MNFNLGIFLTVIAVLGIILGFIIEEIIRRNNKK